MKTKEIIEKIPLSEKIETFNIENENFIPEYRDFILKEDVAEAVEELKKKLNDLLITWNETCRQAILNKKDYGYSVEHIFDKFFREIQSRMPEEINKIFGTNQSPQQNVNGLKEQEVLSKREHSVSSEDTNNQICYFCVKKLKHPKDCLCKKFTPKNKGVKS